MSEFILGKYYKVRLIETLEEDEYDEYEKNLRTKLRNHEDLGHTSYRGHKILFDKSILEDNETVICKIYSREYTIRESIKGDITCSNYKYMAWPCHFKGSLLYYPSFELIENRTNMISVNCSSVTCNEKHIVKCEITELSESELSESELSESESELSESESELSPINQNTYASIAKKNLNKS